MFDDLKNRDRSDRKLIKLKEKHEVDYWIKTMEVSKEERQCVVDKVGYSAEKVRQGLKKNS